MAFRFRAIKHAEDQIPVACILALSSLDFILNLTVSYPHLLGLYFFYDCSQIANLRLESSPSACSDISAKQPQPTARILLRLAYRGDYQSVGAASQLRTSSALSGPEQGSEPLAAQGRQHHGRTGVKSECRSDFLLERLPGRKKLSRRTKHFCTVQRNHLFHAGLAGLV